jgi:hypothetical protein
MILVALSLFWVPMVSSSFGTLFQLRQATPLALSTGVTSTTKTLATGAVAQWINQHRTLTIATTVAAVGLVAAFAYVIKKYRDSQQLIIPPAPPVPAEEQPVHYRQIPQAPPLPHFTSYPEAHHYQPRRIIRTILGKPATGLTQPTQTSPAATAPSSSSSTAPVSSATTTTPLVTASETFTAPVSSSLFSTSRQPESQWKLYQSNNPGNVLWLSRMPNKDELASLQKQLRSQAPAEIEPAPFRLDPANSTDALLMQANSSSSSSDRTATSAPAAITSTITIPYNTAPVTATASSNASSSIPASSSAITTPTPSHHIEPSSRTVLSSSTANSTISPSQGRRSPTISDKANADYRESVAKALLDLTPLLQEQIQDVIGYLPLKTIQLSPEVKALLGLANNLTPEQLQNKLKEICRRYEAGRQLFQKICANHQIKENNNELAITSEVESKEAKAKESVDHQDIQLSDSSFIEVDGPRFIPGEEALSNLLWFFYLYGGLQDEANIFEEGTFTIVGNSKGADNNSLEILLQFGLDSGAAKRLASHFPKWQSYGIDIKNFPLPPVGKQHLLFGKGPQGSNDANRMYFKTENYGVSGAIDGIKHFWEFLVARARKSPLLRKAINYVVEFRSDDTFKKERCPEPIAKVFKNVRTHIGSLLRNEAIENSDMIYRIVEILTELLAKVADCESELPNTPQNLDQYNKFEAGRKLIQSALTRIAEDYRDDFTIRCGNEPCFPVQDLLNAPKIVPSSDGTCLLA